MDPIGYTKRERGGKKESKSLLFIQKAVFIFYLFFKALWLASIPRIFFFFSIPAFCFEKSAYYIEEK